jgi:type IV conjugative transfer system coupling protein TraD
MKRNLGNFTRGSQLLGHFGFMFAAGLKWPLLIAAAAFATLSWWMVTTGMDPHETYLVWMRVYAEVYTFMEFDPAKTVTMETAFGPTFQLPITAVETYPPVVRAWDHLWDLVGTAFAWVVFALVPSFALFYWIAERFGGHWKARRHERGASLVPLAELKREIEAHNRQHKRRELTDALGPKWRLCSPGELREVLPYRPSHIAGVSYPWRLEQSHAMLIGTTGMGKTVALSDMVAEARQRCHRAVIFDLTGAFIEQFHDAERDVILNPLDARCPCWNIFDECRSEGEFWAASEALVPHDGGGEAQFWVIAARALFVEFCLKLVEQGDATNQALAEKLMSADLAKVHAMLRGTIADPITAPEAARMAESVRAVFNVNARALKLLPAKGASFSIRQWIEHDDGEGGFVFLSARYVDLAVCTQLLTLWLDLAMNTLMATPRSRDLKMWFFIDELGALHRLPALEAGLQTARNYGGAIVTGIHAYAKLKEVYGEHMAETLSSLAKTKLILGTGDYKTASWCSEALGSAEVTDKEEAHTYAYNNARDAVSLTPRKHIEALLLPDQLKELPSLAGYIKFPEGFPAAPVELKPVNRPRRAEGFIQRPAEKRSGGTGKSPAPTGNRPQDPTPGAAEHPSSNDDGVGKPSVPKQGQLQLGEAIQERTSDDAAIRVSDAAAARVTNDVLPANKAKDPAGKVQDAVQTEGKVGTRSVDRQRPSGPDKVTRERRADGEAELGEELPETPDKMPTAKQDRTPDPRKQDMRNDRVQAREARRLTLEDGGAGDAKHEPDAPPLDDLDLDI